MGFGTTKFYGLLLKSCRVSFCFASPINRTKATLAQTKITNKTRRNNRKLKTLANKRNKFNTSTTVAIMKIATFSLTIILGDIFIGKINASLALTNLFPFPAT